MIKKKKIKKGERQIGDSAEDNDRPRLHGSTSETITGATNHRQRQSRVRNLAPDVCRLSSTETGGRLIWRRRMGFRQLAAEGRGRSGMMDGGSDRCNMPPFVI